MSRRTILVLIVFILLAATAIAGAYPQDNKLKNFRLKRTVNLTQENILLQKGSYHFRLPSKTEVKVWTGHSQPGKEFFGCVPEHFISFERQSLEWWFQWKTDQKGTSKAVYQIAIFPFNDDMDNWRTPAGLMASGELKFYGLNQNAVFDVDLTPILRGYGNLPKPAVNKPAAKKKVLPLRRTFKPKPKTTTPKPLPKYQIQDNRLRAQVRPTLKPGYTSFNFRRIIPDKPMAPMRKTLYMRVVTLAANGQPIGVASQPAVVHYGVPEPGNIKVFPELLPKGPKRCNHTYPTVKIVSYEPMRKPDHHWCYHFVVTRDMDFGLIKYKKGEKIYSPPKKESKSVWDHIKGAFNSLVDWVEKAVNWVSDAYESIKAKALELAVSIAKKTVGCGDVCQAAFSMALDAGLAAMGMPPSIPNFDEFSKMGKDYLVKKIADETGLPQEAVSVAMDKFQSEVESAASGGKNGSWVKLDPDFQYRDALVTLKVKNNTGGVTQRTFVALYVSGKVFLPTKTISIPPLWPGEEVTIPVFLVPNSMQICHLMSALDHKDWSDRYYNHASYMEVGVFCSCGGLPYEHNEPHKERVTIKPSQRYDF